MYYFPFSLSMWSHCLLFPRFLFIYTVRLKTAASMDTCQWYRDSRGHYEWQLSLSFGLMLSLWMCNCDGGLAHPLIRIGTGEGTLGDELQTLLRIIHPSERLFSPSWNSFPLAAPDSAETLARATASTLFVPKVQLSLLELFRRFSVRTEAASVSSSEQLPCSLEISIWGAVQQTGGAWVAIISSLTSLTSRANVVWMKVGVDLLMQSCSCWKGMG